MPKLFNATHLADIAEENCRLVINAKDVTEPTIPPKGRRCFIYPPKGQLLKKVGMYDGGYFIDWEFENGGELANYVIKGTEDVNSLYIELEAPKVNADFATDADIQAIEAVNCELWANGVRVTENTKLTPSDTVQLRAVDGWRFIVDQFTAGFYISGYYFNLVLSEDSTVYTVPDDLWGYDIPHFDEWRNVSLEQVAGDVVGGINNVYNISREEAKDLSHDIFYDVFASHENNEKIDWGSYVINFMMLPFEIPENYILEKETIQLGNKTTNTKANKLASDLIVFDMGKISVPSESGNVLDFANTIALLHLPFIDPVSLDLVNVIGEDILIRFEIDAYSGLGTYIVDSTKADTNLFMKTVNLAVNIPFVNVGGDPETIFNSSIEIGGDNGVRTPQIEIIRSNSELATGFFSNPILDDGKLIDQAGFVTVENINIKASVMREEMALIRSVLSNGVIL